MDAMSDLLRTIQLSANTYICKGGQGHWHMQIQYRPQGDTLEGLKRWGAPYGLGG